MILQRAASLRCRSQQRLLTANTTSMYTAKTNTTNCCDQHQHHRQRQRKRHRRRRTGFPKKVIVNCQLIQCQSCLPATSWMSKSRSKCILFVTLFLGHSLAKDSYQPNLHRLPPSRNRSPLLRKTCLQISPTMSLKGLSGVGVQSLTSKKFLCRQNDQGYILLWQGFS